MPTISLFQLYPVLEKGKASSSVVGDGGRNSKNFVIGISTQENDTFLTGISDHSSPLAH